MTSFAFIAYPAMYRTSGVKTFVVSEDGVVYEKDLGKKTETMAISMHEFNPDSSWQNQNPNSSRLMPESCRSSSPNIADAVCK